MCDEHCNCRKSFCKGLFWGAVLGGVAGILFAPEKGEKVRRVLKRKAEDLKEKAVEFSQSVVENIAENKEEWPGIISEKIGAVSNFLQEQKENLGGIINRKSEEADLPIVNKETEKVAKAKPLRKGVKSFYKTVTKGKK